VIYLTFSLTITAYGNTSRCICQWPKQRQAANFDPYCVWALHLRNRSTDFDKNLTLKAKERMTERKTVSQQERKKEKEILQGIHLDHPRRRIEITFCVPFSGSSKCQVLSKLLWPLRDAHMSHQRTDFDKSYDVFPHKEVHFGGFVDTALHLGAQIPPKPENGVNTHFQAEPAKHKTNVAYYTNNRCIDLTKILLNDKDQILFFMGRPPL